MSEPTEEKFYEKKISRRQMLKYTGVGAAGVMIGASGIGSVLNVFGMAMPDDDETAKNKIKFYGAHQSGIATDVPTHIYFASLDVVVKTKKELQDIFKTWTSLSVRLMNGEPVGDTSTNGYVPAKDTGEAKGLDAANLTLTFGVGPSLFDRPEFGLASKRPKELKDLPHFPKDQLDPAITGGEICIQACADDPQVAFHAVRNLIRAVSGKVSLKWSQAGFNSFPMKKNKKQTPRNLFAFKDGTANPNTGSKTDMNEVVWINPNESKPWLTGGTYLVARKVQMHLETWDRTALGEQEATFGRHRDSGAPLGKQQEFDEVDLEEKDASGRPVMPADSHVRLAKEAGTRILRRSFSYSSGIIDSTGTYDAGLLFISFQKDPEQFIKIQRKFGRADKLNEYITHRGSALFACFPGIQKGSYIGEALFN
ncbi:iron uptake transporter deferrochelatase/peroxidase subunit [Sporosarcina cyprini]|uniref:iron uptake transporter deferrochelatase/peroxidase subunit n=1 Tax=Sporosarcina cyprini TaxID=2910523 RepID=UPI001EE0D947|nr:iron uptake transporter deferrochelatase/peroxidase subunit [Sporosarcina cyprini]MCG3086619.1 iron uptake transporter deferrochelatase/peroxidase subunit [Sporosarcina cyprini]